MGTIQNTAALYLRKSLLDDRSGDNRSITDQRHDLERLAERLPAGLDHHRYQ